MKGECDEINDEHKGSDVTFGIKIFLTSRPNLSRYPKFFASTRPVPSWSKKILLGSQALHIPDICHNHHNRCLYQKISQG